MSSAVSLFSLPLLSRRLTSLLVVSTTELSLGLSIEVSAETALLVLVVGAHLDVGLLSIEGDLDVFVLEDDEVSLLGQPATEDMRE